MGGHVTAICAAREIPLYAIRRKATLGDRLIRDEAEQAGYDVVQAFRSLDFCEISLSRSLASLRNLLFG